MNIISSHQLLPNHISILPHIHIPILSHSLLETHLQPTRFKAFRQISSHPLLPSHIFIPPDSRISSQHYTNFVQATSSSHLIQGYVVSALQISSHPLLSSHIFIPLSPVGSSSFCSVITDYCIDECGIVHQNHHFTSITTAFNSGSMHELQLVYS